MRLLAFVLAGSMGSLLSIGIVALILAMSGMGIRDINIMGWICSILLWVICLTAAILIVNEDLVNAGDNLE